jgi:hypothetical protein
MRRCGKWLDVGSMGFSVTLMESTFVGAWHSAVTPALCHQKVANKKKNMFKKFCPDVRDGNLAIYKIFGVYDWTDINSGDFDQRVIGSTQC